MDGPSSWQLAFSRDSLDAHARWLEAGRSGQGRLVLDGQVLSGAVMAGPKIDAAVLRNCDLHHSHMPATFLRWAEVQACDFSDCALFSSTFDEATIGSCRFDAANLRAADFLGSSVHASSFNRADASFVGWDKAQVAESSFEGTNLSASSLDFSSFIRCSFRDAQFTAVRNLGRGARLAKFVECDFRSADLSGWVLDGTTFDGCAFAGVRGRPILAGPITVVAPDFSAGFDGSDVRDADAFLALCDRR